MRHALAQPRVQLALRLLLGALFVYASLDKIAHPGGFARVVYQWQVLGPVPSNLVAVLLPWVELVAGVLLLVGAWRREAALVVALMLVVFLGAAASVLARGIDVENCGCVSVSEHAADAAWPPSWTRGVGWFLVTRNLLLLGAALAIALPDRLSSRGRSSAAPPGPPKAGRPPGPPEAGQ